MESWNITLIVIGSFLVSVFAIFACYQFGMTLARIEEVLERWAVENGYRILRREAPNAFARPPIEFGIHPYAVVYLITVEDQQHQQKKGWLYLGTWYMIAFNENIEVRWNN